MSNKVRKVRSNGRGGVQLDPLKIMGDAMAIRNEDLQTDDPTKFLTKIMSSDEIDIRLRFSAASQLLSLQKKRTKRSQDGGQREEIKAAAEDAVSAGRKFAPMKAPKSRVH